MLTPTQAPLIFSVLTWPREIVNKLAKHCIFYILHTGETDSEKAAPILNNSLLTDLPVKCQSASSM